MDACIAALRAVRAADDYPMNWPSDAEEWLSPSGMLQAWVATFPAGEVVGHLVLLQRAPEVSGTDASVRPSAEVTRLFVAPAARRRSVATALVTQAVQWVGDRGLRLILDVVDKDQSTAIAFYGSTGWRHTHTTLADWATGDGDLVYLRRYVL